MTASEPSISDLVARIAGLEHRNVDLEAENAKLKARVAQLTEENGRLRAALEKAQRSGKRQAGPFSKNDPKPNPKKPGRKAGKAYGKKGGREKPDHIDRVIDVPLPEACPQCSGAVVEDRVEQQYQEDLPEPRADVTQFDIHIGHCEDCGCRVQGRHPQQVSNALGAASVVLGPRAMALASELQKIHGLSHGKVARVLASLGGLQVSRGGVAQAIYRVATKLFGTREALVSALPNAPEITPDETGWRVGGRSAWLWVFNAKEFTVYAVLPGRSFADATSVLAADYAGVLIRDGYNVYRQFVEATHQSCLNHLLTRCHEMLETALGRARTIPLKLKSILQDALSLRDRRDADTISVRGFSVLRGKLAARLERLLEQRPKNDEARRLLKHVRTEHALGAVLGFLDAPGRPATNHRAEQDVRPAVVNRKVSGGNRTWDGAIAQEIIGTVFITAAKQAKDGAALVMEILRSPVPAVISDLIPSLPTPGPAG